MDNFKCTRVVKKHTCSINEPEAAPKKADPSADAKGKMARKKNVISSASLEVVYDLVKADAAVALLLKNADTGAIQQQLKHKYGHAISTRMAQRLKRRFENEVTGSHYAELGAAVRAVSAGKDNTKNVHS